MPSTDKRDEPPAEDFKESLEDLAESDPAQAAELVLAMAERLEAELEASRMPPEPEPEP